LEGYFESLAEQGFQNNLFSRSGTKKRGLASPSGALIFQVVNISNLRDELAPVTHPWQLTTNRNVSNSRYSLHPFLFAGIFS